MEEGKIDLAGRDMHNQVSDAGSVSTKNCDAITDDLSSVGHGLANKMISTTAPIRATMMKETQMMEEALYANDDDDDDFFDALDEFQSLTYLKSDAKGPA